MRAAALLPFLCLLGDSCSSSAGESPDVLLIVVDTLRADRLGCAGYSRGTTPHLDRFAARSVVFTRAQSPRAKTTPAMVSVMTGLYPHEHGVRDLSTPVHPTIPTLAEAYSSSGYRTAAIVGNYVLQRRWSGLARGFDSWVEDLPQTTGVPPDDVPQRIASSVTDGALTAFGLHEPTAGAGPERAVLVGDAPWFLYLHYMDPHGLYDAPIAPPFYIDQTDPIPSEEELGPHPFLKRHVAEYNVPAGCRLPDGRADANAVRDRYDAEVLFADAEIGRLLEALAREGLLDDAIVVITSDHGESLGEHRYWFEHGRYAYEATCRVPLILRAPGIAPGTRTEDISLCDLAPTLLELSGLKQLPHPANPIADAPRGRARTAVLRGERDADEDHPVFCEKVAGDEHKQTVQIKAVRIGRWKLIRRYAHRDPRSDDTPESARRMAILSEELYDVEQDPGEAFDRIDAPPAGAPLERLARELDRFLGAEVQFADLAEELAARREALMREDPEREARIKALGY